MSITARLGFHGYRIDSQLLEPLLNIELEQQKDLMFFSERISDTAFVEKIFLERSTEIWVPKIDELVEAGVVHTVVKDIN